MSSDMNINTNMKENSMLIFATKEFLSISELVLCTSLDKKSERELSQISMYIRKRLCCRINNIVKENSLDNDDMESRLVNFNTGNYDFVLENFDHMKTQLNIFLSMIRPDFSVKRNNNVFNLYFSERYDHNLLDQRFDNLVCDDLLIESMKVYCSRKIIPTFLLHYENDEEERIRNCIQADINYKQDIYDDLLNKIKITPDMTIEQFDTIYNIIPRDPPKIYTLRYQNTLSNTICHIPSEYLFKNT